MVARGGRHVGREVGVLGQPEVGEGRDAAEHQCQRQLEVERVQVGRPLLEVLGRTIVHIGGAGAGQVAKACNQMVMVATIEACAEAVRLAAAHGVDLAAVRDALLGGSAGSRVLEVMGERVAAAAQPVEQAADAVIVACTDSVWAEELDLMQEQLLGRLRARLGEQAPTHLRFRLQAT